MHGGDRADASPESKVIVPKVIPDCAMYEGPDGFSVSGRVQRRREKSHVAVACVGIAAGSTSGRGRHRCCRGRLAVVGVLGDERERPPSSPRGERGRHGERSARPRRRLGIGRRSWSKQ